MILLPDEPLDEPRADELIPCVTLRCVECDRPVHIDPSFMLDAPYVICRECEAKVDQAFREAFHARG